MVPLGLVAMFSLATIAAGFLLPDLVLRDEAEKRRRAFRHTLSSYLDLVNVLLAGGAGIETALPAAADTGAGWGYQTIRAELRPARLTGQSPRASSPPPSHRPAIHRPPERAPRLPRP